jgi:predicted hydrocarbon binding protein
MLESVRVPAALEGPFAQGEARVAALFESFSRKPHEGTIRVADERYVLVRCESLYRDWFRALDESFGTEVAREFIYNTARAIGRSDAESFAKRLGLSDPFDRVACGPSHYAYAGWALVEILEDSTPSLDDQFCLHYNHPNTFESEVLIKNGEKSESCACLFSAGYSAGWASFAFGMELHGREIRCLAKGDPVCEFIMAPSHKLEQQEARARATWTPA